MLCKQYFQGLSAQLQILNLEFVKLLALKKKHDLQRD